MGQFIIDAANFIWGIPLLIVLMGGGFFFSIYSRFLPLKYFGHAIDILRGKHEEPDGKGEISHFDALSAHLAATVGMGNIAGVAIAISLGGPGALFWMWVSAFFGMITKFFTCTLAVMYRGEDSEGETQGGPMYVIMEGMGKKWKPLALAFAIPCSLAATPLFQTNQLVQIIKDVILNPLNVGFENEMMTNIAIAIVIVIMASFVIFGGIKRIALVAGKLVPLMILLYGISVFYILAINYTEVIPNLILIFTDAFSGKAAAGGIVGAVILTGVRRAAFSNEAGLGTAPMMHGAAKTNEPIREGLVAMLGPFIDTIVVCTMTGLCILISGVWKIDGIGGIELTTMAFEQAMPGFGAIILTVCVLIFSFTTIFGVSYFGKKSTSFLFGAHNQNVFNYWFIATIFIGATSSLAVAISLIDFLYAMMAFPTMISAIYLAPKVMKEAKRYFATLT